MVNNEKLVGKNEPITNTDKAVADYSDYQAGFLHLEVRLLKTKLFFLC